MGRLPQLDALRGLAVLAMLSWHSADSWLQVDLKTGAFWKLLRAIGGVSAPLFLVVAGAGVSLAASRSSAFRRVWPRGLELVVLGYALRAQTWLFDTGALWDPSMLRSWAPLVMGYGLLWWGARQLRGAPDAGGAEPTGPGRERPRPPWPPWTLSAVGGIALTSVGLAQTDTVDPGRLALLLAPDVLQVIGLAVLALGLLFRLLPAARPWQLVASAVVWTLLTPALMEWVPVAALPEGLSALFVDHPGLTRAGPFPLFPWFAYALAGAAAERFIWPAGGQTDIPRGRGMLWGLFGGALAAACSERHGYMYAILEAHPTLTHAARCVSHLGATAAVAWGVGGLVRLPFDPTRWLRQLGGASLVVYWTHLVFVYGVLANPLKGRLDHVQWGATLSGLTLAMWILSQVRPPRTPVAAHT